MNSIAYFFKNCFKLSFCQVCFIKTSIFHKPYRGLICDSCLDKFHVLPNDAVEENIYVYYAYTDPLANLIQQYKYYQKLFWRKYFAKMMLQAIPQIPNAALLIPVPMHQSRLKERGYNHAWELVKYLSKFTNIPCSNQLVSKVVVTATQAGSTAKKRRQQQKNSFVVAPNNYQFVIIVDDIITTGSTIMEIIRVLKLSGVAKVQAWCLAKA